MEIFEGDRPPRVSLIEIEVQRNRIRAISVRLDIDYTKVAIQAVLSDFICCIRSDRRYGKIHGYITNLRDVVIPQLVETSVGTYPTKIAVNLRSSEHPMNEALSRFVIMECWNKLV